jgi:hypothetical protein
VSLSRKNAARAFAPLFAVKSGARFGSLEINIAKNGLLNKYNFKLMLKP